MGKGTESWEPQVSKGTADECVCVCVCALARNTLFSEEGGSDYKAVNAEGF